MKTIVLTTFLFFQLLFCSSSFGAIVGLSGSCVGGSSLLNSSLDTSSVGTTWTSSNPAVATVSMWPFGGTAVVSGHTAGTSIITFSGPSGIATTVFTVTPAPPAIIGGTTPICVGGTTTLTNASSGGTWNSSYPGMASVSVSTGVVTGHMAGMCTISYHLVPTCAVTKDVTVNAMPAPDTLTNPSTLCPGATVTFTSSTVGGTWSSSNPAVATVDATTGVVGGIGSGIATITHSFSATCGAFSASTTITVTTTISAGTISGTPSILIGSGAYFTSSEPGGIWSSSNPSVATVSAYGAVNGIASGTALISYTVTSGTCPPATATYLVTVPPPSCISGTINFSGPAPSNPVRVLLINYNPTTLMLTSTAMQTLTPATGWNYSFCGLITDSFRVKAFADTIPPGIGHFPTYHTSSIYWNTANVIYHTTGTVDAGKDINMIYGVYSGGPGFVAGNVTTGANKGTADAIPAVGMQMYCVNNTTGEVLQQAITNSAGNYSFSGLPTGVAMTIYPEAMNYATTPYPTVTLTSSASSVTAANFKQSTLYRTIVPITSSVANVANADGLLSVYPNPATNAVTVQWANLATTGVADITITDVTGRVVLATTADMNTATGHLKVNISQLAKGLYVLHVRGNGLNATRKVEVE